MTAPADSADPFGPLRRRFLDRCREDLALVERALAEPGLRSEAPFREAVHRLSGAAGTFGYPAVSERASRIDDEPQASGAAAGGDLHALAEALRDILV
jgi:HPt (histidine-containing phosphotransfer) domain-containing protein